VLEGRAADLSHRRTSECHRDCDGNRRRHGRVDSAPRHDGDRAPRL